ncbi:MAG: hypothetical protein AAF682_32080 [Planctomycetota bacterium]
MARPSRITVNSGDNAWENQVNTNFQQLYDRPLPILQHAGDLASLEAVRPAAQFEWCLAIVDYDGGSSPGQHMAFSNGTVWKLVSNWELFRRRTFRTVSMADSLQDTDDVVLTSGGGSFNFTLPAISDANEGRRVVVKHIGTGTVTLQTTGADTIDGAASLAISTENQAVELVSDGTSDWVVFAYGAGGGGGSGNPTVPIIVAVGDESTVLTTGTAKVTFRMPYAFTLSGVRASLTTASSSGVVTVDVNEGGSSVLSTKLSIDQGESTSTTAATPAVISDAALADDTEITIDVDAAGAGAAGLKVTLIGSQV